MEQNLYGLDAKREARWIHIPFPERYFLLAHFVDWAQLFSEYKSWTQKMLLLIIPFSTTFDFVFFFCTTLVLKQKDEFFMSVFASLLLAGGKFELCLRKALWGNFRANYLLPFQELIYITKKCTVKTDLILWCWDEFHFSITGSLLLCLNLTD